MQVRPDIICADGTTASFNYGSCSYPCSGYACTADSGCPAGSICSAGVCTRSFGDSSSSTSTSITQKCVTAIEDSYVKEDTPTAKYGGSTQLKVGTQFLYPPAPAYPANILFEMAYFKFDQSQFPASYTKATFKVSQSGCGSGAGGMDDYLHVVTSDWSEGSLVWGNKPSFNPANWGTKRMGCGEAPSDSWYQWDITSNLKSTPIPFGLMLADYRYNPSCDGNYGGNSTGVMCRAGAGRESFLNSKETDKKPQICFDVPCTPPPSCLCSTDSRFRCLMMWREEYCSCDSCAGVNCTIGKTCYQGQCYPTCLADNGCPAGSVCTSGACIPSGSSSSACQKTTGDANCDGQVNEADYTIWRCEYLGNGTCASPLSVKTADFSSPSDGKVDLTDFEIWRAKVYGTTNIPTPPAP